MNSKQLIENCSKGDHKAQKAFFYRYADILYVAIRRYIKDSSTIDDILFQGMMKIYSKLEDFTYINENALIGWLKRIVVNEALMHLRSDFRTVYKVEEITEHNWKEHTDYSLVDENNLMDTINQLPDGYRTVFLLHVVDGYSHKEIAAQLEIAEGTSRSQFFKARNLLQEKLKKDYGKGFGT